MTQKERVADVVLQAVARGWCAPENEHKTMDVDLAKAIAAEVVAALAASRASVGEVDRETAAAPESLLRKATTSLPEGCYCTPGNCGAPRIMGRQMPCRDPDKAAGKDCGVPTPPPQPKDAEVVAWRVRDIGEINGERHVTDWRIHPNPRKPSWPRCEYEPLYLHPTPPASQAVGDKDGERYRWLRSNPCIAGDIRLAEYFGGTRLQDFDALIDAAMLNGERGKV